jgi:elongation factor 1-gamma
MAPKLTGFAGNSRVRRILAAAALAGVELEYDNTFTFKSEWKTPEFLAKFPLGYLPVLEDGDLKLQESGAIAAYVAELGPNQTILPADLKQKALVQQWMFFADQEIMIKVATANAIFSNRYPYHKGIYTAILDSVNARLATLEQVLLDRTWLVGERITLADVFVATALTNAFSGPIDASMRAKIPNVVRYLNTFVNQEKLKSIFDNGNPELTQERTYQPPAKPAAAEKPKAAASPAEKKEKAPKKKEVDEEEEEPLVPAEPKVKNPLDDLPKSAFNLEEWKRQYSNLDTRKEALPWFYEKFDREGFSVWRVDFKYNTELTQVFMSSNQIGGFFNRLEASRKYLFGSMGVLGKANDSIISGAVICRGLDYKPVMDVAPDWESYEYKKIDLDNADDKAFFEAAMAWDLIVDGKEWADGKNFK